MTRRASVALLAMLIAGTLVPGGASASSWSACGSIAPFGTQCSMGPMQGDAPQFGIYASGYLGRIQLVVEHDAGEYRITCSILGIPTSSVPGLPRSCTAVGTPVPPHATFSVHCAALPLSASALLGPDGPWGCRVSTAAW